MKKILFITGRLPFPLDDGWKLRTYHLLKGIACSGYAVDLLTFTGQDEDRRSLAAMKELCGSVFPEVRIKQYAFMDLLNGVMGSTPFSVLNYYSRHMARSFTELTKADTYACIQFEDIVMTKYIDLIDIGKTRLILDMHNIESHLLKRYAQEEKNIFKKAYAHLTASKLNRYEIEFSKKFSRILVCSPEDASILASRGVSAGVEIVPNGVDVEYFKPTSEAKDKCLVFVGTLNYHANVSGVLHFAKSIFPHILERNPDIQWYIVGKDPTDEIEDLASENIIVTGPVPDVRPYLSKAAVVVAPLLVGGGTRLKILEAMAMQKAVVSTSIGAEGIGAKHGENIILADSDQGFASEVNNLLEDQNMAERLGCAARRYVEAHFSWNYVTNHLLDIYSRIL
jgi:sugar transferase (PEP-CTERM/EpsH1 system associated)